MNLQTHYQPLYELIHSSHNKGLKKLATHWQQTDWPFDQHGLSAQWQHAVDSLPDISASLVLEHSVSLQTETAVDTTAVTQALQALKPWRKGPFDVFDVDLDAEWRCDLKWQRIASCLPDLSGRYILDVGCGNGYYGWRLAAQAPSLVLGIDPTLHYIYQYAVFKRYAQAIPFWVLPLTLEAMLIEPVQCFDLVLSMGVLYHRRSPIDHLLELRHCLKPGGQLLLETLYVDGDAGYSLVPDDRYACMRNVWFIPTIKTLRQWLVRCGFVDVEVIDESVTTPAEQRATAWSSNASLIDFLNADQTKTVEGYPAPRRVIIQACRP